HRPGPPRMYPPPPRPPPRGPRARVGGWPPAPHPRPWEREARYTAAGVQVATTYFLIRRGGARLVDLVTEKLPHVPLRKACEFFGERLKGLRRDHVAVDAIEDARWLELFDALGRCPLLWEAWEPLVRAMAAAPRTAVGTLVAELRLGEAPADWQGRVRTCVSEAIARLYRRPASDIGHRTSDYQDRLFRFAMGLAMRHLRGKVAARAVADAITTEIAAR
ncbi:MAG: hypothetical protein ACM3NQ_09180, partial [Bacteroidales bacterium]